MATGLLDAYGRPINTAVLKTEQGAPTTRGVRRHDAMHPAAGLTPGRLARVLRDSIDGVWWRATRFAPARLTRLIRTGCGRPATGRLSNTAWKKNDPGPQRRAAISPRSRPGQRLSAAAELFAWP